MIDLDAWEERAAIMECGGGLTRFRAETEAARQQGYARWEAMNALGSGDTDAAGDQGAARNGHQPDNLPGMQPGAEEADGTVPFRNGAAGRRGLVLPSLRISGRRAVR